MFTNDWFLRRALAIACMGQPGAAVPTGRPQVIAHLDARDARRRLLVTRVDGDTVHGLGGDEMNGDARPVSMSVAEAGSRRVRYVVYVRRHMYHERRAWRVVLGVGSGAYRLAAWLGDLRLRAFWRANMLRASRMEVLARIARLSGELSSPVAPSALLALADWPQVPRDAAVDERRRFLDRTLAVLVASGFAQKTAAGGFEVQPRGEEALERYDADLQRYCHQAWLRRALNVLIVAAGIAAIEAGSTVRAPHAAAPAELGAAMSCSPDSGCAPSSCNGAGSRALGDGGHDADGDDSDAVPAAKALDTSRRVTPHTDESTGRLGDRPGYLLPAVLYDPASGGAEQRLATQQHA